MRGHVEDIVRLLSDESHQVVDVVFHRLYDWQRGVVVHAEELLQSDAEHAVEVELIWYITELLNLTLNLRGGEIELFEEAISHYEVYLDSVKVTKMA